MTATKEIAKKTFELLGEYKEEQLLYQKNYY